VTLIWSDSILIDGSTVEYVIPNIYDVCLEEAHLGSMRNGNGEGAVMYISFKNSGLVVFKNRSRHKRDFLDDYGLSCSGFQEHAEQAVLNDALKYARDNNDTIFGASIFIAGYVNGNPYKYKKPTYICMNCASYIREVLPMYSTYIYLPNIDGGWFCYSPFELYRDAVEAYTIHGKTSEARLANLEVIENGKS
jgi:hypothetical protein